MLNLKFSFPLEKEYIRKNQLLHNFGTIGRILSTIVVSPYLFGKISLFSTEKIPIICVYQLFSSTHPDRDHISIFQDKILFHVCHLIHIYQVTLMAPQKTLLSDPGLDIIQFVLRHNLTAIFEMECDDMTVAVNIEDIIGVGITELPSRLYCYPVPVTGFQCFLQKTYQLRCRKGLEDIAGSFHFITFDCKIRRHGQKTMGAVQKALEVSLPFPYR